MKRFLNALPRSLTPSGCKSVDSCDCRIWIHYLPAQGYIRLPSPKQWILEMARASAAQSQVLTMFEIKLKIQPLSRSKTRQATNADGYRGYNGRDVQTSKTQHYAQHCFFLMLIAFLTYFPHISWDFLPYFSHSSFILKEVLPSSQIHDRLGLAAFFQACVM